MRKRTFPWILLLMLALAAVALWGLSSLRGCSLQTAETTTEAPTLPPVTQPAKLGRAGQLRYHFSNLSPAEQRVYTSLLERLPGFPESIAVDSMTSESISRVFSALVLDQPLLFQISTTHYKTRTVAGLVTAFLPEYRMTREEYTARCQALVQACEEFTVPAGGSQFDIELALHDQLVRRCSYSEDFSQPEKSTAYGALVESSAACEGYARAMQLLLELYGIDCYIVTGEATNLSGVSGGHAWNKVNIEGSWYHLDATWDDPITENNENVTSHAFFNVSDEQLRKTNELTDTKNPCTATAANYFVRKGLLFDSLQRSAESTIEQALRVSVSAGDNVVELRFTSDAAMQAGLKYLFEDQRVYRILSAAAQNGARVKPDTVFHADLNALNIVRIIPVLY